MYPRREKNKIMFLNVLSFSKFRNTIIFHISEGGNNLLPFSWLQCSLKIFQINNKINIHRVFLK